MVETEQELLESIRLGLWIWHSFPPDGAVLYIGSERDALPKYLRGKTEMICASLEDTHEERWLQTHAERFRLILSVAVLEQDSCPADTLRGWREILAPGGKLILAMHNRLGLRYFCGDRDPHTGRNFDGIEGYRRAYAKREDTFRGRMYSRVEISAMLDSAGWRNQRFYAVLPGLEHPTFLYAEDYLPQEDLATRLFPVYHCPNTVFLEEECLYGDLAESGIFHALANAYLVECAADADGQLSDVLHVTNSLDRGRERSMVTTIHGSGAVIKRAAYPEGEAQLRQLAQNMERLREQGIPVVDGRLEGHAYIMPHVQGETGQLYLKRLLLQDREAFLEKMDQFRDLILASSETREGIYAPKSEHGGKSKGTERKTLLLRHACLDMVPLNSFYLDGTFVFYDQEFSEEDYPANAVLARMVATFYAGNPKLAEILPPDELYARYGLLEEKDTWLRIEWNFLRELRKEEELAGYHARTRRDPETVNSNRQRMNWSAEDYRRLFEDIFADVDTRKLILFGSGRFASRFLGLYGAAHPVYAIVDNREERWDEELEGVRIHSPNLLAELQHGEYKIIICIKDYLSVMRQLDGMGIHEYSIFDPGKTYLIRHHSTAEGAPVDPRGKKKYHVGYIAGVFDLFHVGHLRLFQRAKEQCDYLIVGVVTDEVVRSYKQTEPFIPFGERMEIVKACRYVDEVAEIPPRFGRTVDAWKIHHFDVQFSGSDYINDPEWLREKEFLEAHGATMEFFPYTESTSSTKLKQLIEERLIGTDVGE